MKFLHLSDLHLGKRVCEQSMLAEQRAMLDQALALARRADVTLIAGDIYDRQVPPAEAVTLFDEFLTRMSAQGSRVVLIAGNHDSAERVAFGARLLDRCAVHVSTVYDGRAQRVELIDEHGPVHIHLLPFVKPSQVRAALGREDVEDYTDAIRAAVEAMDIDLSARNVLVAHQFVTGASRSESEEISIGGLDDVDASVFDAFDYVALGHLHRAQSLCGGRVRYSGAPLCYAFSECEQEKGALLVELGEKGDVRAELIPMTPARRMRRLRGPFALLCDPHRSQATQDYVQITLTDEDDVPEAVGRLREMYPNLLQLLYDNARTRAGEADFSAPAALQRAPSDWFAQLYAQQNGAEMTEEQRGIVEALAREIWEGDA